MKALRVPSFRRPAANVNCNFWSNQNQKRLNLLSFNLRKKRKPTGRKMERNGHRKEPIHRPINIQWQLDARLEFILGRDL